MIKYIMNESIAHIANQIKEAREAKGLSQRALSKKVGIPQSHISKIENGIVNLQLGSLIELARVLDMELMLIPRHVEKITTQIVKTTENRVAIQQSLDDLDKLANQINSKKELSKIAHQILNDVKLLRNSSLDNLQIREINQMARYAKAAVHSRHKALDIQAELERIRKQVSHPTSINKPRVRMFELDEES